MFLATTGICEFWDKSSELLLLGEWCRRYDRKNEWESLSYKVLPYPWTEKKKIFGAYHYCSQAYELILDILAQQLNIIHSVAFSKRYWRIVIGEWLWRYIQVVFDRYTCLEIAFKNFPSLTTLLLEESSYQYPSSYFQSMTLCNSDLFNLQIYSQILNIQGRKFPSKIYSEPKFFKGTSKQNRIYVDKFRDIIRGVEKYFQYLIYILPPRPQVVFCGDFWNIPRKSFYRLLFSGRLNYKKLGFRTEKDESRLILNKDARKRLSTIEGEDSFQTVCLKMLEYQLPQDYLENYKAIQKKNSCFVSSSPPKVIISPVGWRSDLQLSGYIADCVEKGSLLIGLQHGGGYGLFKLDSMLDHEMEVCDYYFSWGWKTKDERVVPLPISTYDKKSKIKWNKPASKILFVSNTGPLYFNIFQSSPIGPEFKKYFLWQKNFLLLLEKEVMNKLVFRCHPAELGWFTKLRLQKIFTGIKFDNNHKPLFKSAIDSDLVIIDNNQTSFLVTIGHNIPTIIFWDPNIWSIRTEALPYFYDLEKVGVFHRSYESAAEFINNNFTSIEHWWNKANVQKAVWRFRNNYALYSENWVSIWKSEIEKIIDTIKI